MQANFIEEFHGEYVDRTPERGRERGTNYIVALWSKMGKNTDKIAI